MTKTKKFLFAVSICATAFALCACASQKARYVDSAGTETVVSLNKVDIQDFRAATNALVADMLQWDAFAGAKKPVVALSRVVNDTSANFDTALLTNQVQEAILKSRKATISMSMSADRNDDVVRQDVAALGGTKTVVPDLTLIGKISEVAAKAGDVRQVTYVFQMRLVETASGNVVWMNSKEITKQGEKNAVGW